jgi:hypothetical protein
MTEIGYQHGITAMMNRLRDLDPGGTILKKEGGKWPSIDTLTVPVDQWKAYDKAERAFTILVHDHDAAVVDPPKPPDPEPPDPEPGKKYAPRTYNSTDRADARFCMKEEYGVVRQGSGYVDQMGVTYDDGGRDQGGRSKDIVPGLKGADSMDGREPCDPYTHDSRSFPPYPAESFNK